MISPYVLLLRTGRGQKMTADLQELCVKHGLASNVPFRYISDPARVAELVTSQDPKPCLVIATGILKAHDPHGRHVDARGWIKRLACDWGAQLEFVSE